MQKLIDGLILYHGSYCEVKNPEVRYGTRYKDFGQGFYLTSSKKQAQNFVQMSVKKAAFNGKIDSLQEYGFVSSFQFSMNKELNIQIYPETDSEWLHCIVGHRRKNTFPKIVRELKKYDIVVGKIANDNTNATIATYMVSAYGEIGSKSADTMCISLLMPERLQDQFCFRTNDAIKSITFVESERVWL